MRAYSKENYQANREKLLAAQKRWRDKNKEYSRVRRRRWYAENREHATQYATVYAKANSEKTRANRRARWVANGEALREKGREWKRQNKERANYLSRRWYRENRDRAIVTAKLNNLKRAARERGAVGIAVMAQIIARVSYYGHRCYLCRAPYEAIDHVKPLARGGSNWPANLRPICKSCNSGKRDKWPFVFRRAA